MTTNQKNLDNHANQCNPNNIEFKGYDKHYMGDGTKADLDNHANQLNPNNPAFNNGQDDIIDKIIDIGFEAFQAWWDRYK